MMLLSLHCLILLWFGASAQENIVVSVSEDEDALLPCSLVSKQKVKKFDWRKDDGENPKKEVFFYDRGSHYLNGHEGQDEQFKQRVAFFEDEIESGNASIKIINTRLEDNGTYSCVIFVQDKKEIQIIVLNVGAAPEPIVKPIQGHNKWSLLECKVEGAPKPDVQWRNSAGEVLAELTNVKENKERFLKLYVNVTKSDNYTCVAIQESICHKINSTLYQHIHNDDAVDVVEGDDAVLRCSLNSKEDIKDMAFTWRKGRKEVYSYSKGVGQNKLLNKQVSHFESELKFGNASIKIHNIQLSDNGRYTCNFPDDVQEYSAILTIEGKESTLEKNFGLVIGLVIGLFMLL